MSTFVRQGHEGVKFFVGPEIEQTPAFGKKTLFVVGLQELAVIDGLAKAHKTSHIFLSANRSFDGLEVSDKGVYQVVGEAGTTAASAWEAQIHALLDKGYMVSLDYPAHKHDMVLKVLNAGIWQSRNFVPILSVAVPHVSTSSKNLTVKIDDINFKATNPGVWCMHHTEVTDSNRFTDWQEYGDDLIISETEIQQFAKPITTLPVRVAVMNNPAAPANEIAPIGVGGAEVEPAYAEVNAPGINLSTLKEKLAEIHPDQNDGSLGLDPDGKSKLKPDAEETITIEATATPIDALEAYTEGAKVDPLGQEASKKPTKKKA